MKNEIRNDVLERFVRYVIVNTQSKEGVENVPSTGCQHDLAAILFDELKSFGIKDVTYDRRNCYVYARIPANRKGKSVPIAFIAHMDTSPESSGADVRPVLHRNYDGSVIRYSKNPALTLSPKESPQLLDEVGRDIITSDGTTLLGADDKAGVAEIMSAAKILASPDCAVEHGDVYIVFTPDEEVGNGTAKIDLKKCPAKYGFTLDGEDAGELNRETFCAREAKVAFTGVNTHPGTAYGRMKNTLYAMAAFLSAVPRGMRPETTRGRTGFFHPLHAAADVENAEVRMIIRDFDEKKLDEKCKKLKEIAARTGKKFPGIKIDVRLRDQYRNMGVIIDRHPKLLKAAENAVRAAGLKPFYRPIRGGTDGARLTFMGLPTLNVFAGMFNPHSKNEWASLDTMVLATETIINLTALF